jgi:truncated hemoglobin YjbI
MDPLYERLGGKDAITAVVEDFVARCAADDRINAKFARTDIARLKKMLVDQICQASGGLCSYQGRAMRETHDGMGVTAGEFDALVEDLVATLNNSVCRSPVRMSCWASSGRCAPTSWRRSRRIRAGRFPRAIATHRRWPSRSPRTQASSREAGHHASLWRANGALRPPRLSRLLPR